MQYLFSMAGPSLPIKPSSDRISKLVLEGHEFNHDMYCQLMQELYEEDLFPNPSLVIDLFDFFCPQLEYLPNVVRVPYVTEGEYVVVGDLHGKFYDLCNILKHFDILYKPPKENFFIIFNGDFIDRGAYSLHTFLTLVMLRHLYPNNIFLNRGNHESVYSSFLYGYLFQLHSAYGKQGISIWTRSLKLFKSLPLITVYADAVAIVHGGISVDIDSSSADIVTHSLEEINDICRFVEPGNNPILENLLWVDPIDSNQYRLEPSQRGIGYLFPEPVTRTFLESNNLKLLVRSHEMFKEPTLCHGGKCITVFSSPAYCDSTNPGFCIKFHAENLLKEKIPSFETWTFEPSQQPSDTPASFNPHTTLGILLPPVREDLAKLSPAEMVGIEEFMNTMFGGVDVVEQEQQI
eukprot:TRINITY_DN2710_c0_g1_i1.p1 TRINITY_DN2710_c0_g1~~TRINITY_DN2710_c0_g1_i1.p1  ORF type:complete len:405 (+),score=113.87 TRINITY_DN2710_c0_g1_i1:86-1300(+)